MNDRIQHCLTEDGGFAAVDHHMQVASYAYPTSVCATSYANAADKHAHALQAIADAAKCHCSKQVELDYYRYIRDAHFASAATT